MRTDERVETEAGYGTDAVARRAWVVVLALVLLGVGLHLPRLGDSGLWDPWEPRYAQSAREMSERGDWIVPYYAGYPRLNKAPMTYWLIGMSHALLGVREISARLPSALLAILAAAALGWAFACRGRPLEGAMAGAALLSAPQWALAARFATPDMPLAAFLGLALVTVLVLPVARGVRAGWLAWGLLVVLVAAAGLSDWPRGLLLPLWGVLGWGALRWGWKGPLALAAVAAVYHWGQLSQSVPLNLVAAGLAVVFAALVLRLRARVGWPAVLGGAVMIALLVAPWFAVAYRLEPEDFSLLRYKYAFNLGETFGRHTGPYIYPLRMAAIGALPWSALAVVGLMTALRRRGDETARVLTGALLGGVLFFTFSEAQMGHFQTVLQPAIAGLAGIGAVALMRRLGWSVVPAALALLAVFGAVWKNPGRILETATVKSGLFGLDPTFAIIGVVVAWVVALAAARIRGREGWVLVSVAPAALLAGALGMWLVPALAAKKSMKPLWDVYAAERVGEEPLGFFGPFKESIRYYSMDAVDRLRDREEMTEFLTGPAFLIGTNHSLETSRWDVPGRWETFPSEHPTHRLARYEPFFPDYDRLPAADPH
jgi:hypothetical protein